METDCSWSYSSHLLYNIVYLFGVHTGTIYLQKDKSKAMIKKGIFDLNYLDLLYYTSARNQELNSFIRLLRSLEFTFYQTRALNSEVVKILSYSRR